MSNLADFLANVNTLSIIKSPENRVQQMVSTCECLFAPGDVVELRLIRVNKAGTVSGYFDDFGELARHAFQYDGRGQASYITLHTLKPECLLKKKNGVQEYAQQGTLTTDNEILRYRNMLIDFDPIKPVSGISSSDDETRSAIRMAAEVRGGLIAMGFPQMLLGCSGNGAHLIARIDMDNTKESVSIVKRVLHVLAEQFKDMSAAYKVDIDRTVYNPARISKLYGTKCCKGENSPERPHRWGEIIYAPKSLDPVPRQLLSELASKINTTAKTTVDMGSPESSADKDWSWLRDNFSGDIRSLDIEALFAERDLDVNDDGTCDCPWRDAHSMDSTGTKVFFADVDTNTYPGFNCKHDHCRDRTLRDLLVWFGPDLVDKHCGKDYPKNEEKEDVEPLIDDVITRVKKINVKEGSFDFSPSDYTHAQDDKKRRSYKPSEIRLFPEPKWIIDNHIQENTTVTVYGAPSSYKSFYALDMAFSVATGLKFLNKFDVVPGPVLYVYAEGKGGMRRRLLAWETARGVELPDDTVAVLPCPFRFDSEGKSEIKELLQIAKKALGCLPSFTVVDTLARNFGNGNENDTKDMNAFVDCIDAIRAITEGVVLVVHHTGKDKARGARGAISLTGAHDTIFALDRPKHSKKVKVECEKQKDGEQLATYDIISDHITFDGGDSLVVNFNGYREKEDADKGAQETKHQAQQKVTDKKRLEYYSPHKSEAKPISKLAQNWQTNINNARNWNKDLYERELLERCGDKSKYLFYLSDLGRNRLSFEG